MRETGRKILLRKNVFHLGEDPPSASFGCFVSSPKQDVLAPCVWATFVTSFLQNWWCTSYNFNLQPVLCLLHVVAWVWDIQPHCFYAYTSHINPYCRKKRLCGLTGWKKNMMYSCYMKTWSSQEGHFFVLVMLNDIFMLQEHEHFSFWWCYKMYLCYRDMMLWWENAFSSSFC